MYFWKSRCVVAILMVGMVLGSMPQGARAVFFNNSDSSGEYESALAFPLTAFSPDRMPDESLSAERLLTWLYEENDYYQNLQTQLKGLQEATKRLKNLDSTSDVKDVQRMLALDPSLYPSRAVDGRRSSALENALTALDKRFGRSAIKDKDERRLLQLVALQIFALKQSDGGGRPVESVRFNANDRSIEHITSAIKTPCPYRVRDLKDACKVLPIAYQSVFASDAQQIKKERLAPFVKELAPAFRGLTTAYNKGSGLTTAEKKVMSAYLSDIQADVRTVEGLLKKGRVSESFVVSIHLHMNIIQANVLLALLRGYVYEMIDFADQLMNTSQYFDSALRSLRADSSDDVAKVAKFLRDFHASYAAFAAGDFKKAEMLLQQFQDDARGSSGSQLPTTSELQKDGREAAIRQSMATLRSQAEIEYNQANFTYATVCENTAVRSALRLIDQNNQTAASPVCRAEANAYVISALLSPGGQRWCIDSTGYSGLVTRQPTGLSCGISR